MALTDKDIVIIPNKGTGNTPTINLVGSDASNSATITVQAYNLTGTNQGVVPFSGSVNGTLLTLTDTATQKVAINTTATTGTTTLWVNGSIGSGGAHYGSNFYGSYYYDSTNNSYYIKSAGTSQIQGLSALGSDASSNNPTGLISITRANQGGTNNYAYYGMYNGSVAVGMGLSTTGQWLFGTSSAAGVNSTIATTWAYFDTSGNLYSNQQFRSATFADKTSPATYYLTPGGTSNISTLIVNSNTYNGSASSGVTRSLLNSNGDFYSYYSNETNARIVLGRDIGISGGAGLALGGGTYALIGTNDTSGTNLYFKVLAATSTVSTSPQLTLNNSSFTSSVNFYAPLFYDSANNAYYVQPSQTTRLNNLTVTGSLNLSTISVNNLGNGPYTSYYIGSLGASATQAIRYEIARIYLDIVNWHNAGAVLVELHNGYYTGGDYQLWSVSYDYNNVNVDMIAGNAARGRSAYVSAGTPVQYSGNYYYVQIFVNVRNYASYYAFLKTDWPLYNTTSPSMSGGGSGIYTWNQYTTIPQSNIADFTAPTLISSTDQIQTKNTSGIIADAITGYTSNSYYLKLSANSSNLYSATFNGTVQFGPTTQTGNYNENIRLVRSSNNSYVSIAMAADTSGAGSIAGQFNQIVYPSGTNGGAFAIRSNATDVIQISTTPNTIIPNGSLYIQNTIYDNANSAYYLKPSGTSNINYITYNNTYFDFNNLSTYLRIITGGGTFYIGDDDNVNLSTGALYSQASTKYVGVNTTGPDTNLQVVGHVHIGNQNTFDNPGGWNKTILLDGTNHARIRLKASAYGSYPSNEVTFWHDNTVTPNAGITSPNEFYINASYTYASGSFRAPIFYDTDNTSYYADPASTNNFNVNRSNAIQNGSANMFTVTTANYAGGATPATGYLITTNIPFTNFQMPNFIIEGYAYGNGQPIHIEVVYYTYPQSSSGNFVSAQAMYYGWNPGAVYLAADASGNVVIWLQNNIYYGRMNVRFIGDNLTGYTTMSITEAACPASHKTQISLYQIMDTSGGWTVTGNATFTNIYVNGTYYDGANNSYYIKPSGTSQFSTLYSNVTYLGQGWASNALGVSGGGQTPSQSSYDFTISSTGGNVFLQSWNSKPLYINNAGNNVYIPSSNIYINQYLYYNSNTAYYLTPAAGANTTGSWTFNSRDYHGNYLVISNGGGVMGDYSANGTTSKVIWTIGESWPLANMYGIGYQYGGFGPYGTDHLIVLRENGSTYTYFGMAGNMYLTGSGTASGDWRAPIFYDYNNTGYYADPNSTSNFNALQVQTITKQGLTVPGMFIQTATPSAIQNGDLWWNLNNGTMYIWYSTANSWVVATPVPSLANYLSTGGGIITGNLGVNGTLTVGGSTIHTGQNNVFQTTSSNSPSISYWTQAGFTTFGPNAGNIYGSALALGYNTSSDRAEIISLAPSNAWKYMGLFSNQLGIFSNNGSQSALFDNGSNFYLYNYYYDWSNTAYYVRPRSTSNLYAMVTYSYQGNGNVGGTGSASWHPSGIYSAGYNWLYGGINAGGSNIVSVNAMYASIYYDNDNSGYYANPNSLSNFYQLNLNAYGGNVLYDAGFAGGYPSLNANSYTSPIMGFTYSNNAPYTGSFINFGDSGYNLQLNSNYGGGWGLAFRSRNGDNGTWNSWYYPVVYNVNQNGGGNIYSSVWYDADNTGYYIDANNNSSIYSMYVNSNSGIRWSSSVGDTVNASSWYGIGWTNFSGAIGGTTLQVAGYYGLRLRSNASVIDVDGPNYGNSWVWVNTNFAVGGQNRGTIFYDYNDTTYYVDPNSQSYIVNLNAISYTVNTSYYNQANFIQNWNGAGYGGFGTYSTHGWRFDQVNGANSAQGFAGAGDVQLWIGPYNTIRGPSAYFNIWYDWDNTGYYADPNGTSNMNVVNMQNAGLSGGLWFNGGYNNSYNSDPMYIVGRYQTGNVTSLDVYIGDDGRNNSVGPNNGWGGQDGSIDYFTLRTTNGYVQHIFGGDGDYVQGRNHFVPYGSVYANTFYSYNNSGYYSTPNGTTNYNTMIAYSYQGNGNVGGTGSASWHPSGMYSGGTQWLYGDMYRNGAATYNGGIAYYTIMYDNNNSGYYCDPNGTNSFYQTYTNISQYGSSGNWNQDFYNAPAGTYRYGGDVGANGSSNPGGSWWMQQNFRHTNGGSYWGTQVAWGWEDNANRLATRNVSNGNWGGWVYYINSNNYTGYNSYGSIYFTIGYDNNNSGYYIDPNGTSQLSYVLADNWFRPQGATGVYFQSVGRGLRAADYDVSYGNVSTYGGGLNGWSGWSITPGNCSYMSNGGGSGLYVPGVGQWTIYSPQSATYVSVGTSGYNSGYNVTLNGSVYSQGSLYSAGNVYAYSDRRKKREITTVENALDKVLQLRGVYYYRIYDPVSNIDPVTGDELKDYKLLAQVEDRQMGVIAQEVDLVVPEVVRYDDINDEYSVSYGNFAGLFIEAFKDMKKEIDELRAELNMLKGQK